MKKFFILLVLGFLNCNAQLKEFTNATVVSMNGAEITNFVGRGPIYTGNDDFMFRGCQQGAVRVKMKNPGSYALFYRCISRNCGPNKFNYFRSFQDSVDIAIGPGPEGANLQYRILNSRGDTLLRFNSDILAQTQIKTITRVTPTSRYYNATGKQFVFCEKVAYVDFKYDLSNNSQLCNDTIKVFLNGIPKTGKIYWDDFKPGDKVGFKLVPFNKNKTCYECPTYRDTTTLLEYTLGKSSPSVIKNSIYDTIHCNAPIDLVPTSRAMGFGYFWYKDGIYLHNITTGDILKNVTEAGTYIGKVLNYSNHCGVVSDTFYINVSDFCDSAYTLISGYVINDENGDGILNGVEQFVKHPKISVNGGTYELIGDERGYFKLKIDSNSPQTLSFAVEASGYVQSAPYVVSIDSGIRAKYVVMPVKKMVTDLNDHSVGKGQMAYPNPCKSNITLKSDTPLVQIFVYNDLGILVAQYSEVGTPELTLDTADYKNGLYYYKTLTHSGSFVVGQ